MDTFMRCPNCRQFTMAQKKRGPAFYSCDNCHMGYIENVDAFFIPIVAKRLEKALGTDVVILHTWEEDIDGYGSNDYTQQWSLTRCLEEISQNSWYPEGGLLEIHTIENIYENLEDGFGNCGGLISIRTPKQQEEHEQEERRKQLERYAVEFAAQNGVPVSSIEMLQKIDEAIDQQEANYDQVMSAEARFEHGCACVAAHGSAYGAEIFHSDMEYTQGKWRDKFAALYGVKDWIAMNCPLLWAKYQESIQE